MVSISGRTAVVVATNDGYLKAGTPVITDNSDKVATTAFVNNRLPYSIGTWTPILQGDSTLGSFTYASQNGYYIKIDKLVYIYAYLVVTGVNTIPTGNVAIGGLPFISGDQGIQNITIRAGNNTFAKAIAGTWNGVGGNIFVMRGFNKDNGHIEFLVFSTTQTNNAYVLASDVGTIMAAGTYLTL